MKINMKAMILGGLAIAIISVIPLIGWLWFVWAVLGGMLAVYLHRKSNPADAMQTKDGVITGLGAGIIGGIIMFFLALIVSFLVTMIMVWIDRPNLSVLKAFGETLEIIIEKSLPLYLFQIALSFVASILTIALAALGGFLGWNFFVKNAAGPASNFGASYSAN